MPSGLAMKVDAMPCLIKQDSTKAQNKDWHWLEWSQKQ